MDHTRKLYFPSGNFTFDPNDLSVTYTIRVTITDHLQPACATDEEQFQIVHVTGAGVQSAK